MSNSGRDLMQGILCTQCLRSDYNFSNAEVKPFLSLLDTGDPGIEEDAHIFSACQRRNGLPMADLAGALDGVQIGNVYFIQSQSIAEGHCERYRIGRFTQYAFYRPVVRAFSFNCVHCLTIEQIYDRDQSHVRSLNGSRI